MSTFVLKNLRRLFDKYAVARTEPNALVKSTTKIFSNFVAFSENPNFTYLENTERREVIRQTWGTVQKESDQESKLIFVTGQHYQTKQRSQKMKSLRSPKMDVAWTKNRVRRSVVILLLIN